MMLTAPGGHRLAMRCLGLLSLLLCCGPGGCRRTSPGSPAPQLTDLRSQISGVEELLEEFRKQLQQQRQEEEGGWHRQQQGPAGRDGQAAPEDEEETMQQQLQEVAVRPAGDGGEELCNFSQQEDYIIRTKDSLEAGAAFLRAPGQLLSWRQCLELCCAEPRCSAAVTERSGRGLSCFLFDCAPRGRHVCQFSPHRDYSSFSLTGRNASVSAAAWTGASPPHHQGKPGRPSTLPPYHLWHGGLSQPIPHTRSPLHS